MFLFLSFSSLTLIGCLLFIQTLPVELTRLPILEKLYLDYNKLSLLPPELGEVKTLKVLRVDYNMLVSVPGKPDRAFTSKYVLESWMTISSS